MQESRVIVAVIFASVLMASCGGDDSPTRTPTPAPILTDYSISGSQTSPNVPVQVDDELRLFVDDRLVATVPYSGVAHFQAYPGSRLTVQALDTCQGQYYLSELWFHGGGFVPWRVSSVIRTCTLDSVPCISTVDCGAPDRIFFQQEVVLR